jgi:hypothetical protein
MLSQKRYKGYVFPFANAGGDAIIITWMTGNSTAYFEQMVYKLHGEFDHRILEQAFIQIDRQVRCVKNRICL